MHRLSSCLALALVLTACSGGDPAAEYVDALEAIGTAQRTAAMQLVPDTAAAPGLGQVRSLTELRRGALDEVSALAPPDGLADRHRRFVATLATVVSALDLLVEVMEESGLATAPAAPADVLAAQQVFTQECRALESEAAALLDREVDLSC